MIQKPDSPTAVRVLNLGAGVQSTTLALMAVRNWEYWSCSEAIRVDEGIRRHDWSCSQGPKQELFLHRSCKPLAEADLRDNDDQKGQARFGFIQECEGMCGV